MSLMNARPTVQIVSHCNSHMSQFARHLIRVDRTGVPPSAMTGLLPARFRLPQRGSLRALKSFFRLLCELFDAFRV